jgi:serine/threonine-protein kinase
MDLQIGSTVGGYQVTGILGAGGMGKVYKVRNVISDRAEAMKVLLPDLANAPELADRFLREIKLLASLEHPNIAGLHTAMRVENQLLMLMEFVDGVTLEQKLKDGPLPVPQAVDYMMQALAALEYAHAHGVIHRDIKPANMMLTPAGTVKLMDFGIAKASGDHKLTMTGTTMGSLYYMSPEQIQGAATLDSRADLYSLGVSLYELVTGRRPFDGDSQFAIMSAHLEKTPVPPIQLDPRLPAALNDIILLSVAKDPNGRFQTAGAFRNALASVMPAPAVSAPVRAPAAAAAAVAAPAAQPAAARPKSKRGLWMAIGAVAMAAAIIAAIQFAPWKGTKAAPAAAVPAPIATPPAQVQPQAAPPQPAPATAVTEPARPSAKTPRAQNAAPQTYNPQPAPPAAAPTAVEAPPQPQSAPAQAAPAPPPIPPAMREQLMMLNNRASGIRDSMGSLQRSQQAQGMNLSSRFTEPAGLMDSFLKAAGDAVNAGDAASAQSFMDKAERQVEILEKLLNR